MEANKDHDSRNIVLTDNIGKITVGKTYVNYKNISLIFLRLLLSEEKN